MSSAYRNYEYSEWDDDGAHGRFEPMQRKRTHTQKTVTRKKQLERVKIYSARRKMNPEASQALQGLLGSASLEWYGIDYVKQRSKGTYGVSVITPNVARAIYSNLGGNNSSHQIIRRFARTIENHVHTANEKHPEYRLRLGEWGVARQVSNGQVAVLNYFEASDDLEALNMEKRELFGKLVPSENKRLYSMFKNDAAHISVVGFLSRDDARGFVHDLNDVEFLKGYHVRVGQAQLTPTQAVTPPQHQR